jgi:hypothetical protein
MQFHKKQIYFKKQRQVSESSVLSPAQVGDGAKSSDFTTTNKGRSKMLSREKMLETATDTYNGKTGCACGCGGSYASVDSLAGQKRIKKIMNADASKVVFHPFTDGKSGCFEIYNQDGSRVVRVYVKVGA